MAVFYDTGGGDIYGGPTYEAVIAAMRADSDDIDEEEVFEVSAKTKIRVQDENERPTDELLSLEEAYGDDTEACCLASENY
jgi:hypothetical protein